MPASSRSLFRRSDFEVDFLTLFEIVAADVLHVEEYLLIGGRSFDKSVFPSISKKHDLSCRHVELVEVCFALPFTTSETIDDVQIGIEVLREFAAKLLTPFLDTARFHRRDLFEALVDVVRLRGRGRRGERLDRISKFRLVLLVGFFAGERGVRFRTVLTTLSGA